VGVNFLSGLALLLVYQLLGEALSLVFQLSVSGPVIGMLLLFISLFFFKKIRPSLETSSAGILGHLSLLFIPAGVGLMVHFERLQHEWLPVAVAIVLGAVISFVVTAWMMQLMIRLVVRSEVEGVNGE
jgi:holin-like protein